MPLPQPFASVTGAFLLGFPALFSIVNPVGASLIFAQVLSDRTHAERSTMARRVAAYSLMVLVASLWVGSYVLSFFGISLSALRIAGGVVVAVRAWSLLNAPEVTEARRQEQASPATLSADAAFFPLTMPFTTGPGTIGVAIALGSERPSDGLGVVTFLAGMSLAATVIALMVWVAYWQSDRLTSLLGQAGSRVLTRLVAFLLLCIGTQILVNGVEGVARSVLHGTG